MHASTASKAQAVHVGDTDKAVHSCGEAASER